MAITAPRPPGDGQSPASPKGANPVTWQGFAGLNTEASRPAIDDEELAWCDGFMPIGAGNLRTLWGLSASFYTASGSLPYIVSFETASIGTTVYVIVFLSNGAIVAVNYGAGTSSVISAAGTIVNPARGNQSVTQWGGQYIIIVAASQPSNNGLFVWDGTTFHAPGSSLANPPGYLGVSASFSGYISATTLTVTGVTQGVVGTGQTFLSGGTGLITAYVTGTGGAGTYTVGTSQTVGSSSAPAQFTTSLYSSTVPTGVGGTAAEVYAGRLWVIDGPSCVYSSPGSFLDFNTANGSGSFSSDDSFLRVEYIGIKQTNGFLYLIGDSSINYISGVVTSGSPSVTTFTNQNADPELGTPYADAIDVLSRNIIFANTFGVHISYGGAVAKVSDKIDGLYTSVGSQNWRYPPSSAKAILFGKKVWMVLVPVVYPPFITSQAQRLLMWLPGSEGRPGRWFTSAQDVSLTYIRGVEVASNLIAFGTDGLNLYTLFAQPSTGFVKTAQSKLWSGPVGLSQGKTADRFWGCVNNNTSIVQPITLSVDTDQANYGGGAPSYALSLPTTGAGPYVFPPLAVGNQGALVGMTISTSAPDVSVVSLSLDVRDFEYRG